VLKKHKAKFHYVAMRCIRIIKSGDLKANDHNKQVLKILHHSSVINNHSEIVKR